jgi:hypothetical protein
MTMQRINLYQDDLKEPRVVLPAGQMLAIAGLALVGMVAVSAWVRSLPEKPRQEANALKSEVDQLDTTVKNLQKQVANMQPNQALIRQAEALQHRLGNIRALRRAVLPPPSMALFSSYLEGLGRQSRDGLWLTEIRIGDQGRSFLLRGGVLEPGLLFEYMQALESEPVYTGLSFDNLNMSAVDDDHPYIQFSIGTRCLPDEKCE